MASSPLASTLVQRDTSRWDRSSRPRAGVIAAAIAGSARSATGAMWSTDRGRHCGRADFTASHSASGSFRCSAKAARTNGVTNGHKKPVRKAGKLTIEA